MAELTIPSTVPDDSFRRLRPPITTNVTNIDNSKHIHNYSNTQSFVSETTVGTTIINEQRSAHPALSDDVARLFSDIIVDCAITAHLEVPLSALQDQTDDGPNSSVDISDIVLDELQDPSFRRTPEQSYFYANQLKEIISRMKEGKHILTEDDLNNLSTSLLGPNSASRGILGYDRNYVRWKLREGSRAPLVANLLEQMRLLSQFVQRMEGNETIGQLVDALRLQTNGGETGMLTAWRLLWLSLLLDHSLVIGSQILKTQILSSFGLPCPQYRHSFNITLKRLVEAGIEIIPTENIREHFQLDGTKLKVLKLSPVDAISLASYSNNLVARAFDIETLGSEILHSLYILYGRDRYRVEAEALGLGPDWTWNEVIHREDFLRNRDCQPKVLRHRIHSLEQLIQFRRSWLPSLIRDVRKSKRQQPFVFWASVLAIIYGMSSVTQILLTIWSIILVYKPPSHPS